MKNKFLFIIAILSLSVIACKKSYTCDCTTNNSITYSGFPITIPATNASKAYSEKMTEKQAQSACDHEAATIQSAENDSFEQQKAIFGDSVKFKATTTCILK